MFDDDYVPGDEYRDAVGCLLVISLVFGLPTAGIVHYFMTKDDYTAIDKLNDNIIEVVNEENHFCIEILDGNICIHDVYGISKMRDLNGEEKYVAYIGEDSYVIFSAENTVIARSLKEVANVVTEYKEKGYTVEWIPLDMPQKQNRFSKYF